MESINLSVQNALKSDKILPRAHGSPGVWISFLVPTAVIISSWKIDDISQTYVSCAIYSFNMLLNVLHLLFHISKYKSLNVSRGINILCAIPASITIFLYTQFLDLDFRKSLCHTVANALIYFEGLPFLLKVFPRTFTFGEVNIAIQGLSLFIYSLFLNLNNIIVEGQPSDEYNISTVILQLTMSWVLVFCVVPYTLRSLRKVYYMYMWGLCILALIYLSVYNVLNCSLFLFLWLFLTKPERSGVIILWLMCSVIAVTIVHHQINSKKKSDTVLRKYFHILAVIVFLSGTLLDVNLLYFSSGCVFGIFIVLEVFRVLKLPPFYKFLQGGFYVYSDEKDSGVLALTPICLLVGSSLPLWLHPLKVYSNGVHLQLLSGILSVGIGDTFASVGGKFFGRHHWKGSSKTIEGTVCCILSQVIFVQILVSFGLVNISSSQLVKGYAAIITISIIEAKTNQIDNIVLPLLMYILLML